MLISKGFINMDILNMEMFKKKIPDGFHISRPTFKVFVNMIITIDNVL